jgi:hypothetical protein
LRFENRFLYRKAILAKLISAPNFIIKGNPKGALSFGKHILEEFFIAIEINDSGPIINMDDINLGFGLDLDVRLLAYCQMFQLKEGSLAPLHAGDKALHLLALVADVVLNLLAGVEVGCAVVRRQILLGSGFVLLKGIGLFYLWLGRGRLGFVGWLACGLGLLLVVLVFGLLLLLVLFYLLSGYLHHFNFDPIVPRRLIDPLSDPDYSLEHVEQLFLVQPFPFLYNISWRLVVRHEILLIDAGHVRVVKMVGNLLLRHF